MAIDKQSADIAAGVWVEHEQEDIGAGDQACRDEAVLLTLGRSSFAAFLQQLAFQWIK